MESCLVEYKKENKRWTPSGDKFTDLDEAIKHLLELKNEGKLKIRIIECNKYNPIMLYDRNANM